MRRSYTISGLLHRYLFFFFPAFLVTLALEQFSRLFLVCSPRTVYRIPPLLVPGVVHQYPPFHMNT